MYPTSTPSLQFNENLYHHPHTRNLQPEDPDIIETYLEDDPAKLKDLQHRHDGRQTHWRNQLTSKREKQNHHHVSTGVISATLPSHLVHHNNDRSTKSSTPEYAYAYCEPVTLKLPPQSLSPSVPENSFPKPNSIRALLGKNQKKDPNQPECSDGVERHTFTTRYGTKENIYEDVGHGHNGPVPVFNIHDELRHVQTQHDRVMGQLNLSVEALIMPSKDEQDMIEEKFNELNFETRLSPTTSQPSVRYDIESGFSESSSSEPSYAGSMLYRTMGVQGGAMTMMPSSSALTTQHDYRKGEVRGSGEFSSYHDVRGNKVDFNAVIPNSNNELNSYPINVKRSSKPNSEESDNVRLKSNIWNKIGKLKISGVFAGNNIFTNSPQHHPHPTTSTNTTMIPKSSGYHV